MNYIVLCAFLSVSAIAVSSAGLIEIVIPENYTMGEPITQTDDQADSFGSISNSDQESIKRQQRAFDTYITLFCYSPHLTVFDFNGGHRHPERDCHGNKGRGRRSAYRNTY